MTFELVAFGVGLLVIIAGSVTIVLAVLSIKDSVSSRPDQRENKNGSANE